MAGQWYPESRFSRGSVLVDGFGAAGWRIERAGDRATLRVDLFTDLAPQQRAEVEAEGQALVDFIAADAAEREVIAERFDPSTWPRPAAGAR